MTISPKLSVIVPVLNEAPVVAALFAMLGRQEGVDFELILSDGGSADGTVTLAAKLFGEGSFPCTLVQTEPGRGRQLNAGAAAARGEMLLFLHADSRLSDPLALAKGLAAVAERSERRGDMRVAGHFALRFDRTDPRPSFPFHFYETKARLDRPGTIHGDQGYLLPRAFFDLAGPFREDLEYLEDDRLADSVRRQGEWLLLPAEIHTSARRFETEGLRERQSLNALLLNFAAIGRDDLLHLLPGWYRRQDRAARLDLHPMFRELRRRLAALPVWERFSIWYRTGSFVRGNAWQLPLAWQARRTFRKELPPGSGSLRWLHHFDRWFDLLTDHPPGRLTTAALVWLWFRLSLVALSRRPEKQGESA